MINGEGRVYEIKSDLDNFDRLYDQLEIRKISLAGSQWELHIHRLRGSKI